MAWAKSGGRYGRRSEGQAPGMLGVGGERKLEAFPAGARLLPAQRCGRWP